MKSRINVAITAAIQGDMALVDKVIAKLSNIERKLAAYKRDQRDTLVGMPWRDLPLKKRASFSAKYVWDPDKGKFGKFVKRNPPLSPSAVYKKMLKQSKRMERMGSRIGKKGAAARKHYKPLASAIDMEGL